LAALTPIERMLAMSWVLVSRSLLLTSSWLLEFRTLVKVILFQSPTKGGVQSHRRY
jgi:hypothetical protein